MRPAKMKCYHCGEEGETRLEVEKSTLQWLLCLLIGLLGGWIFCLCFIPFCIKTFRRYDHYCQKCGTNIAHRDPLQ